MATGRSWISRLIDLPRRGDVFVASGLEAPYGRLFGGLIAAQSLASAAATVEPEKLPQSLHAYFIRPGRPEVDVHYEVELTRDGRAFDTRRVTARQGDKVILELIASFHVSEDSSDWSAESLAGVALEEAVETIRQPELAERFEMRVPKVGPRGFSGLPYWVRSRHEIEDDPIIRACTLTFLSDMGLMGVASPPDVRLSFESGATAASLDHTIWFHRAYDPMAWHRYDGERLNFNDSRGLARGELRSHDGALIASMAQEALWRLPTSERTDSKTTPAGP